MSPVPFPPVPVILSPAMADAVLEHAGGGLPDEACGVILGTGPVAAGGSPTRYIACRNTLASPYRFAIDPADVHRILLGAEAAGESVWAIVHSHPESPAVPSRTDLEMAAWWPTAVWILVSLDASQRDPGGRPSLRAWSIRDGVAEEVAVVVAGS